MMMEVNDAPYDDNGGDTDDDYDASDDDDWR